MEIDGSPAYVLHDRRAAISDNVRFGAPNQSRASPEARYRNMPAAIAGPEIERLIQLLARLPGLGPRSARRAALALIKRREQLMAPLAAALETAMDKISVCKVCG